MTWSSEHTPARRLPGRPLLTDLGDLVLALGNGPGPGRTGPDDGNLSWHHGPPSPQHRTRSNHPGHARSATGSRTRPSTKPSSRPAERLRPAVHSRGNGRSETAPWTC